MAADNSGRQRSHDRPAITVQQTRPGRVVFTESDNPDGWIATDLTVTLDR